MVDKEELLAVLNLNANKLNEIFDGDEIDYIIDLIEKDMKDGRQA